MGVKEDIVGEVHAGQLPLQCTLKEETCLGVTEPSLVPARSRWCLVSVAEVMILEACTAATDRRSAV